MSDSITSNAFNYTKDLAVHVSPRTGMLNVQFKVVSLPGKGSLGLSLSYGYSQGNQPERYENIAPGWSMTLPYYDEGTETVHLGDGSSYLRQGDTLRYYLLKDLAFQALSQPTQAPDGQMYSFFLLYLDGRIDYLDENGNIVCRADRFGNFISFVIASFNSQTGQAFFDHIVDTYGQTTSFKSSSDPSGRIITLPDGQAFTLAINSTATQLIITDPVQDRYTVEYDENNLVNSVNYPTGLTTQITYGELANPGNIQLMVVQQVSHVDENNAEVMASTLYDFDPDFAPNDGHNFLGPNPQAGTDSLMESNDNNYFYWTAVSQEGTISLNAYNHVHLLVGRQVIYQDQGGSRTLLRKKQYQYIGQASNGDEPPFADLPPNYQKVATEQTQFFDENGNSRTIQVSYNYNDFGQKTQQVAADGTITEWQYDLPDSLIPSIQESDNPLPLKRGPFSWLIHFIRQFFRKFIGRRISANFESVAVSQYGLLTQKKVTTPEGSIAQIDIVVSADGKTPQSKTLLFGKSADSILQTSSSVKYSFNEDGTIQTRELIWVNPPQDPQQNNIITSYSYEDIIYEGQNARKEAVTDAIGNATSKIFNAETGQAIADIDAMGRTTSYQYDALGRVIRITYIDGSFTAFDYSLSPEETTITQSNGRVVNTTYDLLGRAVKTFDNCDYANGVYTSSPSFLRKENTYNSLGQLINTTTYQSDGVTVLDDINYCFDPLGRLVTTSWGGNCDEPNIYQEIIIYDDSANTITKEKILPEGQLVPGDAMVKEVTFKDEIGRTIRREIIPVVENQPGNPIPLSRIEQYSFNGFDRVNTFSDNVYSSNYNYSSRMEMESAVLTDSVSGFTREEQYSRNLLSQVIQTTASLGENSGENTTSELHNYNAIGQANFIQDQLGQKVSFTYFPDGSLQAQQEIDGTTFFFLYDEAGRKTDQFYVPPGETGKETPSQFGHLQWEYFTADESEQLQGLLKSVSQIGPNPEPGIISQAITYGYSNIGQLTSLSYPNPIEEGSFVTCQYSYDELNNLVEFQDFQGIKTTYSFIDQGGERLLSEVNSSNGITIEYSYYPSNKIKSITRYFEQKPITNTEFTYSPFGEVATENTFDSDNNLLMGISYEYFDNGALKSKVIEGTSGSGFSIDGMRNYEYQLKQIQTISASVAGSDNEQQFQFDPMGNLIQSDGASRSYNAINQLVEISNASNGTNGSFEYDQNGNMIKDSVGNSYSYNRYNQLLSLTLAESGKSLSFSYFPNGMRASRTEDGQSTALFYNRKGEIVNCFAGGNNWSSYIKGLNIEAETTGSSGNFLLRDHRNSVIGWIPVNGSTPAFADYDAYGNRLVGPASTTQNGLPVFALQYTGAFYEEECALYYLKSRYYSPEFAVFISKDSYDLLNRYAYADGDPVNRIDPSGHVTDEGHHVPWYDYLGAAIAGALVSVITGGIAAPFAEGSIIGGVIAATVSGVAGSAVSDGIETASGAHVNWAISLAEGAAGGFVGAGVGGGTTALLERAGASWSTKTVIGGVFGGVSGAVASGVIGGLASDKDLDVGQIVVSSIIGLVTGAGGGILEASYLPEYSTGLIRVGNKVGAEINFSDFSLGDYDGTKFEFGTDSYEKELENTIDHEKMRVEGVRREDRQYYDLVVVHGGPKYVYPEVIMPDSSVRLRRMSPESFAGNLGLKDGNGIKLVSCFSGFFRGPFKRLGVAQRLANATRREVIAPSVQALFKPGVKTINDTANLAPRFIGSWNSFVPN